MIYAPTRPDFWSDPRLWDGIIDPRKQMCWSEREVAEPIRCVPTRHVCQVFDRPRAGTVRVIMPNGCLAEYPAAELANWRLASTGHNFVSAPAEARAA